MNSKPIEQVPTAARSFRHSLGTSGLLAVVIMVLMAAAMVARAADRKTPPGAATALPAPPEVDPNTGLPMPPPAPSWKDPNWPDPDKVIPSVFYDGVPMFEVAKMLRKEFNDAFDVLIPNGWQDPGDPSREIIPGNMTIRIQLKNVTASEIFNAMNLVFESESTPVRWELKMNGNRPTAFLHMLPATLPFVPKPDPEPTKRMVYFVGDLLGDETSGGMTMEQLTRTMMEVYQMSYGSEPDVSKRLQFHKEAQLLIFTGSTEQVSFIQSTLSALRGKAQLNRVQGENGNKKKAP